MTARTGPAGSRVTLRAATTDDLPAIERLLVASDLAADGVAEAALLSRAGALLL